MERYLWLIWAIPIAACALFIWLTSCQGEVSIKHEVPAPMGPEPFKVQSQQLDRWTRLIRAHDVVNGTVCYVLSGDDEMICIEQP